MSSLDDKQNTNNIIDFVAEREKRKNIQGCDHDPKSRTFHGLSRKRLIPILLSLGIAVAHPAWSVANNILKPDPTSFRYTDPHTNIDLLEMKVDFAKYNLLSSRNDLSNLELEELAQLRGKIYNHYAFYLKDELSNKVLEKVSAALSSAPYETTIEHSRDTTCIKSTSENLIQKNGLFGRGQIQSKDLLNAIDCCYQLRHLLQDPKANITEVADTAKNAFFLNTYTINDAFELIYENGVIMEKEKEKENSGLEI